LTYIAGFCVSNYSTTSTRTGKPFNPLLGETFECDRTDDLGWKSISEQVSHHPPMLAMHVEGTNWTSWSEFSITSKFRGKYLQVIPLDISHLKLDDGSHFTWRKVTTTVHNIIVGKLWIDNHGDQIITNHVTGDKCHLKFLPYSYLSRDSQRKVTGVVMDKNDKVSWILEGIWDKTVEAKKVISCQDSAKGKPVYETSAPKIIWKRTIPPPEYDEMYNMTQLAIQLNEPEPGVAPTDSRLRPDQRLMEEGDWEEANRVKSLLEDIQRKKRRRQEAEAELVTEAGKAFPKYEPIWFKKEIDEITGNPVHKYKGEYWNCKKSAEWSRCPDIFSLDPAPSFET